MMILLFLSITLFPSSVHRLKFNNYVVALFIALVRESSSKTETKMSYKFEYSHADLCRFVVFNSRKNEKKQQQRPTSPIVFPRYALLTPTSFHYNSMKLFCKFLFFSLHFILYLTVGWVIISWATSRTGQIDRWPLLEEAKQSAKWGRSQPFRIKKKKKK